VAEAPGGFSATVEEDRIEFQWAHPEGYLDGASPTLLVGYNIYRRGGRGQYLAPQNSSVLPVEFLHWKLNNALSFQRKELDSGEVALQVVGSSGGAFTLEQSFELIELLEELRGRSLRMGGSIRTDGGSTRGRILLDDESFGWEIWGKKEFTISPEWMEVSHQMVISEEAEFVKVTIEVEPATLPITLQLVDWRAAAISPEGEEGENLLRNSDFSQLEEPVYIEGSFTFGERYYYVVRAVSRTSPMLPMVAESDNSEELLVAPVDVFPPAAPAEVSYVTGGGLVLLSWAPNNESDLLGYNIYRRQDPNGEWEKVNPTVVEDTFYRDTTITPGETYYYSLAAVDKTTPPNESPKTPSLQVVAQ